MKVIEFFEEKSAEQSYWIQRIAEGNWRAAAYLAEQLKNHRFHQRYGADGRVLLLTQGEALVSFCTLVRQDEIQDDALFPWIGFVYTFPQYRGHRYSQKLIDYACTQAKSQGHSQVYLTSDEQGLYEKYGFTFWKHRQTIGGEVTQVFVRTL